MCMATPLEVISVDGQMAKVRAEGIELTVSVEMVDGVSAGDFVLVHAGYAIQVLEPEEARETLAILGRLQETWDAEDRDRGA